ncbi:MAG: DNA polymerase III subunit alpha, partial [Chitinophagales bacterium]
MQEGEKGLTGREAKIPDRAPEFEDVFVVYPFSSLNHASTPLGMTLRANEFIGIETSELNRLKFSPWKHHSEKLVILAPVTFRNKVDFNAHRLLRAMDNNIVLSKLLLSEQSSPDEIMISEDELRLLYNDFPQIIYNTQKLLGECEPINFEFTENKNKKYFLGSVKEDREKLVQLCEEGMVKRYPNAGQNIRDRYKTEIDVISQKQFSSYFLINHDIIEFARRKNLFYVGRGSGANSMVAYLLYITDVDPIELDLYFERFINPSRKNPPDFDIDFSSDERDEVIKYIFKTHGPEHTALLATYSEMKDDSLLRELGKVFGLPKAEIDALQDYRNIQQTPDHITRLIYQYKEVLKTFPSHLSIHAGGILISERPITYYTALSNPPKGFPLTQFSMQEAEDVGFAKFDILSQRGLGKVRDAVDIIRENQGESIDIHDVKRFMKDEDVRDNLKHAKLMGCFYVESPAMRMLLTKLEAETYLDLVAASSIIRPGVAQSGMMQEYIRRFHEKDHGKSRAIPELWDIMEETFGVMVYQEDVIKVAYRFGGFTLEEADKLRRGMGGKYRGRQEFLDVKDKFFANCRVNGKDEKLINEVWFQMETFGGYAFAKGHSASYAVESYQCMFLKTHYPLEYMVAVINNGGGFFGQQFYIHEARMCGATIHAPEINKSEVFTAIYGKDIYLGLNLVNELEKNLQQQIIEERNRNGEFSSLENLLRRNSITVEQLRILIRIGAFRFTGRTKKQLLWDIHSILGHQKKSIARKELFEGQNKKYSLPELFNDEFEDARDEIEILGFPLCSPFELVQAPPPPEGGIPHARSWRELVSNVRERPLPLGERWRGAVEIIGYYVTYKPTSTKKGEA